MKNLHKQCIALLLSLIMILSLGLVPVAADTTAETTAETEAVATVSEKDTALAAKWAAFGVVPADVDPAGVVTRGLAAKALADALGVSKVAAAHDITDVDEEIAGAVRACRDLGFFEVTDGLFRPNEAVTVSDALKMMAVLIGYPADLVSNGASLALQSRLSKGLNVSFGSDCTWANFLRLLDNTADEELVRVIGYTGGKAFAAEPAEDATFLSEYLHIEKAQGVIGATSMTAIDGGKAAKKGYVRIGGVTYADNAGLVNKIGYEVKVWYTVDNRDNRTAVYTESAYKEEEFITITAEDILPSTSTDAVVYRYEEDDEEEVETITLDGATFIYNGKVLDAPEDADLKPVVGKLEILDSDGDENADVVFISNTSIYVVGEVSAQGRYIVDAYDATSVLRIDEDCDYTVVKKGATISFGDIIPGNVVYAGMSKDGKYAVLDVYALQTTGTLTAMSDDQIFVDGVAFDVSPVNRDRIMGLALGGQYVFYEGMDGSIVGYVERVESDEYAYLTRAKVGGDGGLSEDYAIVRIFTKSGGLKTLRTPKVINLTTALGNSQVTPVQLVNILKNGGDAVERQLIMYRTNKAGEVSHIKLATDYSETLSYAGYNEAVFSKDYKGSRAANGSYTELSCNRDTGLIDNRYYISDATTFFRIPEPFDETKITCAVTAYNYGNLGHNNSVIYDATADRFVKVMVFTGSDAIDSEKMFVVESVVKKLSSDGQIVRAVSGTYQGQEREFIIDEESEVMAAAKFALGDVLNIQLNVEQEITDYEHLFALARRNNINRRKQPKTYGGEFGSGAIGGSFDTTADDAKWLNTLLTLVHGDVTKKSASNLFVKAGSDQEFLVTPYQGGQLIHVVDAEKGTVRTGSYEDVNPYDPNQVIFMRLRYGSLNEAVIFNNFTEGSGDLGGDPVDTENKKQYLKESFSQAEARIDLDYMTHNIGGTSYTSYETWNLDNVGYWGIEEDETQAGDNMLFIQQTTATGYPTALLSSESLTAGESKAYTLEFKFKIENHVQSAGALTRPIFFMNGTNALHLINGQLYLAADVESGGTTRTYIGACADNAWHTVQMSFTAAGTTITLDGVNKGTHNVKYGGLTGPTPQSAMARLSDSGITVPASGAYFGVCAFAWAGSSNTREFDMYIDYVNIDFDGAPASDDTLTEGGDIVAPEEPDEPDVPAGPVATKASYLYDEFVDGAVVGGTFTNGSYNDVPIAEVWTTHESHAVSVIDDPDEAGDKILKITQDGSGRIHPATLLSSSALDSVDTSDYTLEYRFKFDNYSAGSVCDPRPIWMYTGSNLIVLNGGKAYLNSVATSWGDGLTGTLIGDCAHGEWHTLTIRNYVDGGVFKTDVTLDGGATVTIEGVRYGNLTGTEVKAQSNGYTHGADPAVTLKDGVATGMACYFGVGNYVGGGSVGTTSSNAWYRGFDLLLDYVKLTIND